VQVLIDLLNVFYLFISVLDDLKYLITTVLKLFLDLNFFLLELFGRMLLVVLRHLKLFIQLFDMLLHFLLRKLGLRQLAFLVLDLVF